MRIRIEINNKSESPVKEDFFLNVAERTIQESGYGSLEGKNISISLALVDEDEIRELNRKYRKKDSSTDILSFCEYENKDQLESSSEKDLFLGELVLCYNDIKKYAERQKLGLEKELAEVFSHGVLHLLCFGHGEEMFATQKRVAEKIFPDK